MYVCMYVCMYVRTYVCICIYVCVCVCVCVKAAYTSSLRPQDARMGRLPVYEALSFQCMRPSATSV
jgi:hypothetical protein